MISLITAALVLPVQKTGSDKVFEPVVKTCSKVVIGSFNFLFHLHSLRSSLPVGMSNPAF
jgi:hypothetical protein